MDLYQALGAFIGAIVGHMVAAMVAGGSYTYLGGDLFEVTEEPMGCIQGCIIEIVAVGLGAGAGYVLGSLLFT